MICINIINYLANHELYSWLARSNGYLHVLWLNIQVNIFSDISSCFFFFFAPNEYEFLYSSILTSGMSKVICVHEVTCERTAQTRVFNVNAIDV